MKVKGHHFSMLQHTPPLLWREVTQIVMLEKTDPHIIPGQTIELTFKGKICQVLHNGGTEISFMADDAKIVVSSVSPVSAPKPPKLSAQSHAPRVASTEL